MPSYPKNYPFYSWMPKPLGRDMELKSWDFLVLWLVVSRKRIVILIFV